MPNFSANLWYLFKEQEMMDRFQAAAEAGFKAVEFHFPYQWPATDLAEQLAEHGLQQVLINAPPGDWDAGERGIAAVPGRGAEFRDSIALSIEYAKALACPRVHVMAGLQGGDHTGRAMETLAENLSFAAEECGRFGISVLIEALNPADVPGYLIGNTFDALAVLEYVGHDNLYLQYDLYHGAMNAEDMPTTIAENLNAISHMQVASMPGRHEPDGQGSLDYPALFTAIDEIGYTGWIGCEYNPRGATLEGLDWAKAYGIG
ncbi:MAG: TIM barrel protein [Rhodospirillales bacterium]|nr:TIM barrel protein [Rhodospirillales bacterium]